MVTIDNLTQFFGWCTVINIAVFTLSTLLVFLMRPLLLKIHGRIFGITENEISISVYQFLAQFKLAIWIFCLAPYIALKLIS